jgi:hypothetical protein
VTASSRAPLPHPYNAHGLSHTNGLGCSHFARRYSGNHCCFLFLGILRCFSSPRSPLLPMYSATDTPILLGMGFPIQRSPDQSLFSGSPKLIAAYHVFHRLLTPRHPPYTLNSLTIKLMPFSHSLCNCQRATRYVSPKRYLCNIRARGPLWPPSNVSGSHFLVEVNGIEPMTSCVQSRRSPD